MTKQEELTGLYALKEHYRSIDRLETQISRKQDKLNEQMEREIDRREPDRPKEPDMIFRGQIEHFDTGTFSEYTPPTYFSVILGVIHAIAVIVMCVVMNDFYTEVTASGATVEEPAFLYFIMLAIFHAIAVVFLIRFEYLHKASGIIGYVIFCALSFAPTIGPIGAYVEEVPSYIIATMIGLPLVTLAVAIVLKIVQFFQYRALKGKYFDACRQHKEDVEAWHEELRLVRRRVASEFHARRAEMEQLCDDMRKEIGEHRAAIDGAAILHKDFHRYIDYIIRLMETGVADSIKEALQIKHAEDQSAGLFDSLLEWDKFQRKQEEECRWQAQREQWERDRVQADRDRERIEQAERAADELERIRKKLENE